MNTLLECPGETFLLNMWLFPGLQNGFLGPSFFTHRRKSGTTNSTVFEGDIWLLPVTWQYKGQEKKYPQSATHNVPVQRWRKKKNQTYELLPITCQHKGQDKKYLWLAFIVLITWWFPEQVHRLQVCMLSSLCILLQRWSPACWLFLPVTSCIDSEHTAWSDWCPVFQIAAW